jgi:hypothetical protein
MKRALFVCVALATALATAIGLGYLTSYATCSTTEIARLTSSNNEWTAIYEITECEKQEPDKALARVILVTGNPPAKKSWSTAFEGNLTVPSEGRDKSRYLLLKWVSDTTIEIQYDKARISVKDGHTFRHSQIQIRVKPNESMAVAKQTGDHDLLKLIHIALSSKDDRVVIDDGFRYLYEGFGNSQLEPVVNALWHQKASEFSSFNWVALGENEARIETAALWGQWQRELHRNAEVASTAAAFVRQFVSSRIASERLRAISALGAIGTADDVDTLFAIAIGKVEKDALAAVSAVYSIERLSHSKKSRIGEIEKRAELEAARGRAQQLREKPPAPERTRS